MDLQEYFQSYDYYFWEWENEVHNAGGVFETVTIPNGQTIAYEQYVMETLNLLAEESIPPFGSLLLAIVATNPDPKSGLDRIFEIVKTSFSIGEGSPSHDITVNCRSFLDKLSALPGDFKSSTKRKMLFQTIFSGCHNRLSKNTAESIMDEYKSNSHHLVRSANKIPPSYANFQKDFRTLALLNNVFPDTNAIVAAIKNLPVLPGTAIELEEEHAAKQMPDLLTQLTLNAKTFTIGSLIKRLWSGINIPMHHYASGKQPLGGVSDLTNKGDFGRMLLSEFANEDDVFMSRLANNEALYIEREVPPENDAFFRAILIDVSIKNWGTSKILAFASAIAIATHPKTDIKCRIFTVGDAYREVTYNTAEDIIDALEHLSADLSPAAGARAFFESDILQQAPEVFIISSTDSQRTPAFRQVISDFYASIHYILEPDVSGSITFYKIANKGRKFIQQLSLPLEELWNSTPKTPENTGKKRTKTKGYAEVQYPILYPLPQQEMVRFVLGPYIYLLTPGRSLYKTFVNENDYHNKYKGAELIFENLSVKSGGIHTLASSENNLILISYYEKDQLVSYHNLDTAEYHKTEFKLADDNSYKIQAWHDTDGELIETYLFNFEAKKGYILRLKNNKIEISLTSNVSEVMQLHVEGIKKINNLAHKPGNNILQNLPLVCIDDKSRLRFSAKHVLEMHFNTHSDRYDQLTITVNRVGKPRIHATYNNLGNGRGEFSFPDGSRIQKNSKGLLTLTSSNNDIPVIYLPLSTQFSLGIATENDFAGNIYFYNPQRELTQLSLREFDSKYLKPFIKTIEDYGT